MFTFGRFITHQWCMEQIISELQEDSFIWPMSFIDKTSWMWLSHTTTRSGLLEFIQIVSRLVINRKLYKMIAKIKRYFTSQ